MSSTITESPTRFLLRRSLFILGATSLISACGMLDYSLNNANFTSVTESKDGNIGSVSFHYADDEKPYVMQVSKLRDGYGLQAPMTTSSDTNDTNFVFSRTHDYKYFVGIQTKYSF